MKTFFQYCMGLFALGVLIIVAGYLFGPASLRNPSGEHPTGQLSSDHTVVSPGQPDDHK